MMITNDYVLELSNVYYSGQVEPSSCTQRMLGSVKTGVILKDVSMVVHSSEVLAVLGSKGSGKKALLDVIARRVQGPTRGQILLNNHPMSVALFQQACAYVTHKCNLIPGLTVEQTLYFTPTKSTGYLKRNKVKQVMADLALSQLANRAVENLGQSEYRRLMIGVQLIKDPVVLLLDEPTWDLDPLNTYLVVSILSNASKKYGTAIILTMEKPRSDVFLFLERVLYLCLGDVVYAGSTRQMLDYFTSIGFPCPQLENPLMYYLCLSTVDRRSRERFLESNHQIAALVEKFKMEGINYRKTSLIGPHPHHNMDVNGKVPLIRAQPSRLQVAWVIYCRLLASIFSTKWAGIKRIFLRLLLPAAFFSLLWLFYRDMKLYQHTYVTRSGLVLNCLTGSYFLGIINTIFMYPIYRTRYFQESQEGLYGGARFLLIYNFVSIPFSFIAFICASAIVYTLIGSLADVQNFMLFSLILWACYLFTEQQTMAILMVVKSHLLAGIFSLYVTCACITLSSGILRSMKGLQDWIFYLTYATQVRYASAFLNRQTFLAIHTPLPYDSRVNCTNMSNLIVEAPTFARFLNTHCRYANGQQFLLERYARENTDVIFADGILDFDLNIGITFAFALGMIVFNLFLYLVPLPAFVKAKFRE